ncbi:glycosyl transferase family 1 [Streptomyces ruber]|uniref:D-inositol 3-phosphate glycosyltransferase n=2 Tax=Streptomyces TaxID=1883 RepID=A0A918BN38_9ACTN|nr:glycosyltransferase family 4 protein [Streptomyces ruber]GGQ77286.1 glycosyl transferase family 1 [Streptomyces ruber]
MKIAFLINNAYGIGGTIRSTVNLSRALAARHDVEVVSVHRVKDEPALPFDAGVTLTSLIDMREESPAYAGGHPLTRRPCTMFPDTGAAVNSSRLPYSALHDERIGRWLRETDADVVIATRPDLNGYLARDGRSRYLRIGQEHLSLDAHNPTLRAHQNRAIARLDAFVTVSEADAAQYRRALPGASTRILSIPNSVPEPGVEPSDRNSCVIVAAGRLVAVKRYDRLIDAFARIADAHPSWTLRLYGRGPERPALRRRIDELGLYERVFLMGPVSPIETEWAKGAIAAVSSDMESFGMTIVEAMHCGVPVVSVDCPHGPREIIEHGSNGLLVPLDGDGDRDGVEGLAAALGRLMADPDLRARLGAAARARAGAYAPPAVARRYEELLRELHGARGRRAARAVGRGFLFARLRAALPSVRLGRPRAPAVVPEPEPSPVPAVRPLAFARAGADGSIGVRLDVSSLPPGPLDFLARLRNDPKKRHIRVSVPDGDAVADGDAVPEGAAPGAPDADGVRVMLDPAGHELAEGRWDCYVVPRGATAGRTRLISGLAERSRRVGRLPTVVGGHVTSWLPYTTTDGFLALRVWRRSAHAEVTGVVIGDDHATVSGRLLCGDPGADMLRDASVVAVSRQGEAYDFTLPVVPLALPPPVPDGPGDRGEGLCFSFTVPYDRAVALRGIEHEHKDEHGLWDFRLRLTPAGAPVRVGRIGGDVVDRKKIDVLPAVRLPHPERGDTRVKPFFTVTNDLALSLRNVAL